MVRNGLITVIAVCGTLLWVGAARAKFPEPPPLTCAQRQASAVQRLDSLLDLWGRLCTADLNRYGCDADVCVPAASQPLKTGQTVSYAPGDDGAVQAGDAPSYTDNGDGTITDNKTGLMWEKKIKLDGTPDTTDLHDADNTYPWAGDCSSETACSKAGTCCQTDADCVSPHTCTITDGEGTDLTVFGWVAKLNAANFAGYNDWRVPNINELRSIVDFGTYLPSAAAAFQGASCGATCTDITSPTCSCTQSGFYWSSSTLTTYPIGAWLAGFYGGFVGYDNKDASGYYVRAVRGGL